mgnify:CR=1 FL=1
MTPQLIYNHSIEDSDIHNLCEDLVQYSDIAPKYYERFDVKRGLRNADGSGVIAGITRICMVHGYVMSEGERQPIPGQLIYRGYDINDLIENAEREDRYVFEEVAYLLLFGRLPNGADLERMTRSLGVRRELPPGFLVDSIMQSPSNNIMNKLARSVLSLYSYSDVTENTTIEDEMSIALDLIAKMPILMDGAYQAKRHKYDNASLIMHPLRPEENTAESILSLIRNDRSYTKAEAQLLDTLLALHADHGGGNNSTFACRVATSSGTDPFAAYTSAINSLKGPRHGGANIKVVQMFEDMKQNVRDWTDEEAVEAYLRALLHREAFDRAGLIYGMGHAVYSLSDPRANVFKHFVEMLSEEKGRHEEYALYAAVARLAPKVIGEERKIYKGVSANIDFYSGFVYSMLDLPLELYTPIFAISRIAGWSAHRIEELINAGKIIRPAYKSVKPRVDYVPLHDRK